MNFVEAKLTRHGFQTLGSGWPFKRGDICLAVVPADKNIVSLLNGRATRALARTLARCGSELFEVIKQRQHMS